MKLTNKDVVNDGVDVVGSETGVEKLVPPNQLLSEFMIIIYDKDGEYGAIFVLSVEGGRCWVDKAVCLSSARARDSAWSVPIPTGGP